MQNETIKELIENHLSQCTAHVNGDGSHFEVTVISPDFAGKSLVKQQQLVYEALGDRISDGSIHALVIKCFTEEQYQ